MLSIPGIIFHFEVFWKSGIVVPFSQLVIFFPLIQPVDLKVQGFVFSVSHEKINPVPSISPSICRRSVAFSDLHLFSFPLTTSPLNYSKSHVSVLQNENYAFLILVWCFLKQIVTLLLVLSKGVSCSEKSGKQDCHSSIIPLKLQTCKFCTKKYYSLSVCYNLVSNCRVLAEIGFCSE